MPLLTLDFTDLLEFFGVEPTSEEHGISHAYVVERSGLILEFTIRPYDSDVIIGLRRKESKDYLVYMEVLQTPLVKLQREKRSFLEIAPGQVFGNRWRGDATIEMGFRLFIDPDIHLSFFYK